MAKSIDKQLYKEFREELESVVKQLRNLRKEKKISIVEMSETTGMTKESIRLFESGRSESAYLLFAYKKILQ